MCIEIWRSNYMALFTFRRSIIFVFTLLWFKIMDLSELDILKCKRCYMSIELCKSEIVHLSKMNPFTYEHWDLMVKNYGPFRKMDLLTYWHDYICVLSSISPKLSAFPREFNGLNFCTKGWNSDTVLYYGTHITSFVFWYKKISIRRGP